MQRWEYNQINKYIKDEALNKLGQEGWELINFATGLDNGGGWYTTYIFKRPCQYKPTKEEEKVMEQEVTSKDILLKPFQ